MNEYEDVLAIDVGPAPKGRGKKPQFQDHTARLPPERIEAASSEPKQPTTDLSGNRKKHNIAPYKVWVEQIVQIADEMEISKMDAWNAILYLGFKSYEEGNRPPTRVRDRARKRLEVEVE